MSSELRASVGLLIQPWPCSCVLPCAALNYIQHATLLLGKRSLNCFAWCRSVLVTSERACQICHRRIGTAAFVAQPEGHLLHYSCWQRHQSPSDSNHSQASAQLADTSWRSIES